MENVSIPKSLFEQLMSWLTPKQTEPTPEPTPEPVKVEETEQFKAAVKEREDYKAKLEAIEADNAKRAKVAELTAQLQKKEDYGVVFAEAAADEAAGVLVGMTPEQQEWVTKNFRALIAQIDESKLTKEIGDEQAKVTDEDPKARYNALVLQLAAEKKIGYVEAFELAKTVHADAWASFK